MSMRSQEKERRRQQRIAAAKRSAEEARTREEADLAIVRMEAEAIVSDKEPEKPLRHARSQAELRALQQRDLAFKQRRVQIFLVSTNVLISALIALKTFAII